MRPRTCLRAVDQNHCVVGGNLQHPSPLSARRGFMGNGHFKKANDWLEKKYGPDGCVDWTKL